MTVNNHAVRWLWLIMALALIIRLIFVLIIDPSPSFAGGDTDYLLQNGLTLINGTASVSPATGPVYLIFAGIVQIIVGVTHAPLTIRVLNSIMGAALCGFIFVLGKRYLNERAGLLAALLIAVSPMFVIEAGNVLTESVFLFLLFGGLALYAVLEDSTPSADHAAQRTRVGILAGVGVLLGLASLTRAVALLLPAVLVIHLIYRYRQVGRKSLRVVGGLVVTLLIAYVLTLSTWTIYNLIRWQHFVIGAEGLAANVYIGTTNWCGPQCIDQSAGITGQTDNQSAYVQGAAATISADPIGYLRHRSASATVQYRILSRRKHQNDRGGLVGARPYAERVGACVRVGCVLAEVSAVHIPLRRVDLRRDRHFDRTATGAAEFSAVWHRRLFSGNPYGADGDPALCVRDRAAVVCVRGLCVDQHRGCIVS